MSLIRTEIKTILARENMTLSELAKKASERTGKSWTLQGLSRKLIKGTLSYNEAALLVSSIGYKLQFIKEE